MAVLFGEAAALPCALEEQVQIANLLTAYDRWLVRLLARCHLSHHHLTPDLTAGQDTT